MLKKILIFVSVLAIALMLVLSWVTARFIDKEKIAAIESEKAALAAKNEILAEQAATRDSIQAVLMDQVAIYKKEADEYRARVDELEQKRAAEQLSVRRLRKKADLLGRLEVTFPEMAHSDWGVTEVRNEAEDIEIEYLLIPLWFSETFIIDHQNSISYQAQRDKLQQIDSLNVRTIALQDSIYRLEHENRVAFQEGYNEAYAKYQELSTDYIEHLKKPPQVSLGLPRLGTLVGTALAGVLLGTQL